MLSELSSPSFCRYLGWEGDTFQSLRVNKGQSWGVGILLGSKFTLFAQPHDTLCRVVSEDRQTDGQEGRGPGKGMPCWRPSMSDQSPLRSAALGRPHSVPSHGTRFSGGDDESSKGRTRHINQEIPLSRVS